MRSIKEALWNGCGTLMLVVGLAACGKVSDSNHGTHDCYVQYNSQWSGAPTLVISHYQPETCPVEKEPGDPFTVGGQVKESSAPPFPGLGNAIALSLSVYDDYSTTVYLGSGLLGSDFAFFQRSAGTSGDWAAQAFPIFTVSNNPDYMEFFVQCSGCVTPLAFVEIQYAGQPE
jgi:hypothetical protein